MSHIHILDSPSKKWQERFPVMQKLKHIQSREMLGAFALSSSDVSERLRLQP